MASILYVFLLCCGLQISSESTFQKHDDFVTSLQDARIAYWRGDFAESEKLFTATLRNFPKIDDRARADALSELGDVYVNVDKFEAAAGVYRESFRLYKKLGDQNKMAQSLRNLGALSSVQRRDDEALRYLREALKTARAAQQPDVMLVSQILNSIGVTYYRAKDMNQAEKMFIEASKSLPESVSLSTRADLLNNLGALYHAKRQFEKAEEYLLKALRLFEGEIGLAHPDLTFSLELLGLLYADAGRYNDAEAQYRRALSMLESDKPIFETRIARLLYCLSYVHAKAGRGDEAEATLLQAAVIARRHLNKHPDMPLVASAYAEALQKKGKAKEAEELRAEVRRAKIAAGLVVNALTPN
jgi:tetratricopeptide (TPR) repeat protein